MGCLERIAAVQIRRPRKNESLHYLISGLSFFREPIKSSLIRCPDSVCHSTGLQRRDGGVHDECWFGHVSSLLILS